MEIVLPIEKMNEADVYEFVFQFKQYIEKNPQGARQLLMEHPDLTKALALGQQRLGMHRVDEDAFDDAEGMSSNLMNTLDAEQQELLEQVKNLTPDIVASLPHEQRQQILELRQVMGLPPL